jgi:hypothetical protein
MIENKEENLYNALFGDINNISKKDAINFVQTAIGLMPKCPMHTNFVNSIECEDKSSWEKITNEMINAYMNVNNK